MQDSRKDKEEEEEIRRRRGSGSGGKLQLNNDDELGPETENIDDDIEEEQHTIASASEEFEKFFRAFKINGEYYYIAKINSLMTKENDDKTILVKHHHLPDALFDLIFKSKYVEQNLEAMSEAVRSIFKEYFPDSTAVEVKQINAKLTIDDAKLLTKVRNIDINLRNNIIVFNCLIASQTENKPVLKQKIYTCKNCGENYRIKRLRCISSYCVQNELKGKSIVFNIRESVFVNFQTLEVQEIQKQHDSLSSNLAVPKQLTVKIYGNLVEKFKPGDNVQVIGFPKLEKKVSDVVLDKTETNNTDFSNDLIFDLVIEAHNIQLISPNSHEIITDANKLLTDKDIKTILEFKKKNNIHQIIKKLQSCFAYWVHGNMEIRLTILLQSVGSTDIVLGRDNRKRGNINVLIVGDPGVTKSVLLYAAMNIHPKSMFTSGKGSSGVGLTASIDTTAKGLNKLKVGAVVLTDGGICAVDEFLTISEENQSHLLECMENGVIHINKNGINTILNARTSILGACNPKHGKYKPGSPLADNIELTPQMWSRWDCVTVMLDRIDTKKDNMIADHIISLYEPELHNYKRPIDDDFLYKWLIYARLNNTHGIKFTPEAKKKIKGFYQQIRKSSNEFDVTATPRQLEAVMRFSIALCRMVLENTVTGEMVDIVIDNLTHHYQSAGLISLESGGMVQTAQYSARLDTLSDKQAFFEVVNKLTKGNTEPVEKEYIELELMKVAKWSHSKVVEYIEKEQYAGRLIEPKRGYFMFSAS